MKENPLLTKSFKFALRIVKLCRFLNDQEHEFVLSKQILVTGTSIGAMVEEAQVGEDRQDFARKLSSANKFAFKTNYWLRLLHEGEYLKKEEFDSILADCEELQKLLLSALKTTRNSSAH